MQPQKRRDSTDQSSGFGSMGGQDSTTDEGRFPPPNLIQVPNRELYITDPEEGSASIRVFRLSAMKGGNCTSRSPMAGTFARRSSSCAKTGRSSGYSPTTFDAQSDETRASYTVKKTPICIGYRNVFLYLQKKAVPHKFYPTLEVLKKMAQHNKDQQGKFLTIYPDNEKQMIKIIANIDKELHEMFMLQCFVNAQFAPCDKRVGSLRIVTARYGVLQSFLPTLLRKTGDIVGEITDRNSNCQLSEYSYKTTTYKPPHIRDPWNPSSSDEPGWCDHPWNDRDGGRNGLVYNQKTRTWEKRKK